jgi:phospholipid/cholesterol/gamma-HCH transport system substrate-binding protein
VRDHRPPNFFRIGLITLVVLSAIVYLGFTKTNPFSNKYEFKAAFTSVGDLKKRSPVRIAGIEVGRVIDVETVGDGRSAAGLVTIELKDKGLPLHTDATLKVRPRLFLEGNYFVDMQPGSPSAPVLEDGATIPATQTASPVQIGEVLSALQSDTREDLKTVLKEYGAALEGKGAKGYNRSTKYWRDAYGKGAVVADATRGVLEHDLSEYVAASGVVAGGLDRSPDRLRALITNLAVTATAFASEQQNLSAAIDELPRTLRAGYRALGTLNEAFPAVRRFAADMTPAVRTSPAALDAQLPFLQQMRGLVSDAELGGLARELRTTVPHMVDLNEGGVPLAEQQRALSSCSANVIAPWQEDEISDPNFAPAGKVYEEGVKWLPGIAGESRNFDANGQWVRSFAQNANYAYALGDGRFFFTELPVQGVNPPKMVQPPFESGVPCETQEPPNLDTRPAAPPTAIKVAQDAPGAAARRLTARQAAQSWMAEELQRSPLGELYTLSNELLRADQIDDVARSVGAGG